MADNRIEIPAAPGIDDAVSLVGQLRDADPGDALVLDATCVDAMTTPYLLAVVSAIRSRPADAPAVQVISPTPAFVDSFSDLGLFRDLMKLEFVT